VNTESARSERGAVLAQPAPLTITVDQDATLVEDPIKKKRRVRLHSLQMGDIDAATADALQADDQSGTRRRKIIGERDQQV
jgi:hypothetical protein